jgi:DnaJ-class molecular chaperone
MQGMPPHVADMFKNFGFNFGGGFSGGDPFAHMRQPSRNKDIRADVPIDLASTLMDQRKTVSIQTTNGHRETVEVNIPRGVTSGTQIKYANLGDNFFNTLARGDLYVVIVLQPHPQFEINGLDVVTTICVDCLTAIVGGDIEVGGIDGSRFVVNLPPGTQNHSALRIRDQGIWQIHGSTRGNLYVKIEVTVPRNLNPQQIAVIKEIQSTL